MTALYIIIAIFIFGFLIAIHELGHFTAAKLLGVKVNEFAVGMGPKLLKKQGKETLYTLRLLPIGGFCAMEGEDEAVSDPRAFTSVPRWRRLIILAAGSFMNLLAGFIVIVVLTLSIQGFVGTTLTGLADGFPLEGENGLMVGDTILSVNGERLYYSDDFLTFMELSGGAPVDLVVRRGGAKITLNDFPLTKREYTDENGAARERYGVTFNELAPTLGEKMKYASYTTVNNVRLIRVSLAMLFSGQAGVGDLSGPVGIVSMMSEYGTSAATISLGLRRVFTLGAFIAINLAVMNMLPIPALDGGRILFMLLTALIEKIIRRRVNPKYEGYIHAGAMILLLGLMALVLINDVVRIAGG